MSDPFEFGPKERGFERVDDDSNTLYATDESRDATGNVDREEFAVRGGQGDRKFHAQKLQLDESGKIIGQKTVGSARDREDAVELLESRVRRTTSANFGGFEIGEFNVGNERNITTARQAHLSRPEEAQASDAAKRAPVTTDASRYASKPGELDYPGVDTPSTDPNVLPKDLRQKQRPATTEPGEGNVKGRMERKRVTPLVEDESAAGFLDGEVQAELRSTAAGRAEQPVNVGGERRGSMVADTGLGGVEFKKDEGFIETDRPERDETPPDIARGEDPFDMSTGGGALDGGVRESERDPVTEDDNRSLVTEYGGIPPQNPTTELPGVGESTADKLESDVGVSSVEEFYENREQAESVLSKQFREEARTVAAYSVGGKPAADDERRRE